MAAITSAATGNWSDEEVERLRALASDESMTYIDIADALGRSVIATKHKASRVGIKRDRLAQFARHSKKLREKFDSDGAVIKDIDSWKRRVLSRDRFTCRDCGLHCPAICHAHHIIQRVDAPDKVFDVSNGVALCPNCHALRHVEIGRRSSGNRLSNQQRDYVYEAIANGMSHRRIASNLGVNIKSVALVVKAK